MNVQDFADRPTDRLTARPTDRQADSSIPPQNIFLGYKNFGGIIKEHEFYDKLQLLKTKVPDDLSEVKVALTIRGHNKIT